MLMKRVGAVVLLSLCLSLPAPAESEADDGRPAPVQRSTLFDLGLYGGGAWTHGDWDDVPDGNDDGETYVVPPDWRPVLDGYGTRDSWVSRPNWTLSPQSPCSRY